MFRIWKILPIIGACGVNASALADCSLDNFGRHPVPPAVLQPPAPVDNTYGHFSYGSDIDTDRNNGIYYAWNFVRNESDQNLPLRWDKAGINQISAAIAMHGVACNRNPIGAVSEGTDFKDYIDHDAPIIYSSANQEQKAWVYKERSVTQAAEPSGSKPSKGDSEGWLQHIFSRFSTNYVDRKGEVREISVVIGSSFSEDKLRIEVTTSDPEQMLGLANLPELLGPERFKDAEEQFKRQGFYVQITNLVDLVGDQTARQVFGENEEETKATFLFLSGQKDGTAVVAIPSSIQLARKRSTMVIFNEGSVVADSIVLFGLPRQ